MPPEVFTTVQQWLFALLLYPGLIFGLLFAMSGEWLMSALRPVLSRQRTRLPAPRYTFVQPVYDILQLAGREWGTAPATTTTRMSASANVLGLLATSGPLLALALMPLPGNPLSARANVALPDIVMLLALVSVQPLASAILGIRAGGFIALKGARQLGRLLTGLLPTLIVVAALVEVLGNRSLLLVDLGAAPETAAQTLVRLLSGGVLLLALPWWRGDAVAPGESAGLHAGRLLQQAALSVLWALLVVPVPGSPAWALVVLLGGAMFAWVAMRLLPERLWRGRSERGAASMLWSAAVPLSALALAIGFWWGA